MGRKALKKKPVTALVADSGDSRAARGRRRQHVLQAVVEEYIASGQAVGSGTIAQRRDCDVSAATVRNVLSELEALGYLTQRHHSSGRVPTDLGYRVYADLLLDDRRREGSEPPIWPLPSEVLERVDEVPAFLHATSQALSRMTSCVGLVLRPRPGRSAFRTLQFLRLDRGRVVAVLIGDGGVLEDRVFRVDGDYGQEELDRISSYLVNRFAGSSLLEVQRAIVGERNEVRAACDAALWEMLDLTASCIEHYVDNDEVYVDGAALCVTRPEFEDVERVRQLLATYEHKERIARLLASCLECEGVQVRIGGLEAEAELWTAPPGLAFIAVQFGLEGAPVGSVGVLGPTRMRYDQVIGMVESVAHEVETVLCRADAH